MAEKVIPRLRELLGWDLPIDLLTCLPTDPGNLVPDGSVSSSQVWRVIECPNHSARWRLLKQIRARRHPATAVICSGDAIMARWRTAALLLLPSKFLIVNENADFFWLDRGSWRNLLQFFVYRSGLWGDTAVRTVARVLVFPFSLAYLLIYALTIHLVRLIRLALGLRGRRSAGRN